MAKIDKPTTSTQQSAELEVKTISKVKDATVHLTGDDHLIVEFRIDDLVKRLLPGGVSASSCGGCNGCTGCSM